METSTPLHSDRYRGSLLYLVSPAIAGILVVLGVLQAEILTTVLGVALALYIWLTTHSRYEIYTDRLLIRYMGPRQKGIPLADITEVQPVRIPFGGYGLVVRRRGGMGMVIQPRDPERFVAGLEEARRTSGEDSPPQT